MEQFKLPGVIPGLCVPHATLEVICLETGLNLVQVGLGKGHTNSLAKMSQNQTFLFLILKVLWSWGCHCFVVYLLHSEMTESVSKVTTSITEVSFIHPCVAVTLVLIY